MSALEWGLLVILSVLWGGTFFFTGVAIKELPAFTIVWFRVFIAALALHLVLIAMGQRFPMRRQVLLAFLGMGLLNNVLPFSLIVSGQKEIASGLAAILNATTPLFTLVVAHVLTADEKLNGRKLIGVMLGFCGVVVMIGGAMLVEIGAHVGAQFMVLSAAFIYAIAGIFGRRFKRMGVTPLATATGQVTASTLLLLPVMVLVDQPLSLPVPSSAAILAVIAMALFSTALAYIIYFRLLATAGVTNLLFVTFLIPITAIILGAWRLGEMLALKHYVGMGLIGLGLAIIDGRLLTLLHKKIARA
jgi:drug/metabolite transporter (DMT)-like permease